MEEFLRNIGITEPGNKSKDGSYVIDIPNSNIFGKYFSLLDKSDLVEENGESSQITESVSSIQYESEDYLITLLGNYDTNSYKLTIREK